MIDSAPTWPHRHNLQRSVLPYPTYIRAVTKASTSAMLAMPPFGSPPPGEPQGPGGHGKHFSNCTGTFNPNDTP